MSSNIDLKLHSVFPRRVSNNCSNAVRRVAALGKFSHINVSKNVSVLPIQIMAPILGIFEPTITTVLNSMKF
jgi:hypothetical protein